MNSQMTLEELKALQARWVQDLDAFIRRAIEVVFEMGVRQPRSRMTYTLDLPGVNLECVWSTGVYDFSRKDFDETVAVMAWVNRTDQVMCWGATNGVALEYSYIVPGRWQAPIDRLYPQVEAKIEARKLAVTELKRQEYLTRLLIGKEV